MRVFQVGFSNTKSHIDPYCNVVCDTEEEAVEMASEFFKNNRTEHDIDYDSLIVGTVEILGVVQVVKSNG